MEITSRQKISLQTTKNRWEPCSHNNISRTCIRRYKVVALLVFPILLLLGVLLTYLHQSDAYAASMTTNRHCFWYQVRAGDTLSTIAAHNNVTIQALAQANHLNNVDLILAGKPLCLPQSIIRARTCTRYSIQQNSPACGYRQSKLQYASSGQVAAQLRQAAWQYKLPVNLLYAIAWQESGWNQQAISSDGGLGVMQVMPYTTVALNAMAGVHLNPYNLHDNIHLGALYLHTLWLTFHGNLPQVISAYNEGSWNVTHRGIINQPYVNNVLALMQRY